MRRSLTLLLALSALPLFAACTEDPTGSGCLWIEEKLVAYPDDGSEYECIVLRFGEINPLLPPTTTTAPTTVAPSTTAPPTTAPGGGFFVSVLCWPGTPPRLTFSGVAAAGSQVSFSNPSPFQWMYALPGAVTVGPDGQWSRDVTFEPDNPAMFPFSVTVTNSVAGSVPVTFAEGC